MQLAARTLGTVSLALVCALYLQAQSIQAGRVAGLIEELVEKGRYQAAFDAFRFELASAKAKRYDLRAALPFRAKLSVEVGALQEASLILSQAEPAGGSVARERAALLLALRDYQAAAETAATAYRLSVEGGYMKVRVAYCKSIEAEARLRLGDVGGAQQAVKTALEIVRKYHKPPPLFFAPRIFYAACLVASHDASAGNAEEECNHGLALAEKAGTSRRDVSLGYLALAEARLRRNDLSGSSEAASRSLELTLKLFGPKHQDAARALQILATANLKADYAAAARSWAQRAVKAGLAVFGEGSPGMADLTRELGPCLESAGEQAK